MATFVKAPCDEGVIRSAPDTAPSSARVGLWVLVATILGSSMAFIDGSASMSRCRSSSETSIQRPAMSSGLWRPIRFFWLPSYLWEGRSVITLGDGASLPLALSSSSLPQSRALFRQTCCS